MYACKLDVMRGNIKLIHTLGREVNTRCSLYPTKIRKSKHETTVGLYC